MNNTNILENIVNFVRRPYKLVVHSVPVVVENQDTGREDVIGETIGYTKRFSNSQRLQQFASNTKYLMNFSETQDSKVYEAYNHWVDCDTYSLTE
jgi:hypothetical protein